jgi:predicted DNA-binding transcriptional regulator YafY
MSAMQPGQLCARPSTADRPMMRGHAVAIRSFVRYVERVMWHPTQKFRRTAAGLEMTMDAAGTVEVSNWVLGFGDLATVISPPALRTAVADQPSRALDRYRA